MRLSLEAFAAARRCRPEREEAEILALAEHERLRLGSGHLQTYRWRARGPTVLLMHGWHSSAARLARFVPPLREAGFEILAFDAPGNGDSSGWQSDLAQFERAFAFMLERFGPLEAIVGHSVGARAAVRVLAREPHPEVRAIALLGMPRDATYVMDWFKLTLELREQSHRALREEYVRVFGAPPPEGRTLQRQWQPLRVPALVVHDREDEFAPFAHAQALATQLPNAELHVTEGLRVRGLVRDSATIKAVVSFLARRIPIHHGVSQVRASVATAEGLSPQPLAPAPA